MKTSKFLPVENIIYQTHLPPDAIFKALAENIEPVKFRFFSDSAAKTYEGEIRENNFKVSRIISYRNSFLPRISGVVSREPLGTIVNVKMSIHPATGVFISLFFAFFLIGWLTALFASIMKGQFSISVLLGVVMVLFPYALTMIGFKYESVKTKENLRELFQARIISD